MPLELPSLISSLDSKTKEKLMSWLINYTLGILGNGQCHAVPLNKASQRVPEGSFQRQHQTPDGENTAQTLTYPAHHIRHLLEL
ncbi:hypothetical protein MHYP_G00346440 [Metynnis hypsauchen]